MKRRSFIKLSLFTAISLITPLEMSAKKNGKKTLVLVELDGGNDALNMVVPYTSKKYYELRPSLALQKDDINILNKEYGLNKNLKNIHKLYQENSMAIINSLGYEKPNLSHFKSIQIVETAGTGRRIGKEGWISSYLREFNISQIQPAHAMLIGKRKKGHLFANDLNIVQLKNINSFIAKSLKMETKHALDKKNESLNFLIKQENSILDASKSLKQHVKNIEITTEFLNDDLSIDFKEAVKIIKSPLEIKVIKISQKGYDTHANQISRQSELLKNLDISLASFIEELKISNLYEDVLIMTYSEFGRRVKENASSGTDHGMASSQLILGGLVKGGIYGDIDLNDLHKNNLKYKTDYKVLYNTVLSRFFKNKNNPFSKYNMIDFI